MFKKIVSTILILFLLNSCILIKIDKDSRPLVDFGTPLIGHFRYGDVGKGVIYIVFFCTSLIGLILFAPTQYNANGNNKAIMPVSREISDPLFYTFIGTTVTSFGASSLDTAITYHLANKKIIDLNNIDWDVTSKITKYQAIKNFRETNENSINQDEVNYYRKKLIDGSITEDELSFIKSISQLESELEKELGYYIIKKELENKREDEVKDK